MGSQAADMVNVKGGSALAILAEGALGKDGEAKAGKAFGPE